MRRAPHLLDVETAALAAEMCQRLEVELDLTEHRIRGLRQAIDILRSAQIETWAQEHARAMAALDASPKADTTGEQGSSVARVQGGK